jgi:hypothetical protein
VYYFAGRHAAAPLEAAVRDSGVQDRLLSFTINFFSYFRLFISNMYVVCLLLSTTFSDRKLQMCWGVMRMEARLFHLKISSICR